MKTYTYDQIVQMYGKEIAEKALSSNAEPTSRVMLMGFENPSHEGTAEYACDPVITNNGDTVQAFFYLTEEDEADYDSFDWEGSVEFQIN